MVNTAKAAVLEINKIKQRSTFSKSLTMASGSHPSGFNPHLPGFRYQVLSKLLGASMWFFILYRAREDGPKLLGLRHPWEGHGHHDEHSESH
ncbi:hypothetical protein F5J12DRAFT_797055 [Pisolithus orientalis]|uniref:uncharacterized protein n=1 Tax=Pisolithus orientalis TaxID=936130 RepID=UPI00222415B5|nr:uncharacterized protein F5J12DRAFT_797055 [Pisolithus orientalis]KAI6032883.1 hypothetical protein F5J12DRAFT_797055 [Pisolithus orientalis]